MSDSTSGSGSGPAVSGRARGRLSSVLRLREVRERRALGELAEGRRRVAEAEGRLANARDAYEHQRALPASTVSELRAARLSGLGAHEQVRHAAADLDVAVHQRGELEQQWSEASAARKSAERLAERRAVAAAAAAERAAVRALDELVAQRQVRR